MKSINYAIIVYALAELEYAKEQGVSVSAAPALFSTQRGSIAEKDVEEIIKRLTVAFPPDQFKIVIRKSVYESKDFTPATLPVRSGDES